jgi:hypothetical protein
LSGETVDVRSDDRGDGPLYLARLHDPVQYRLPEDGLSGPVVPSSVRLERDERGPFLWVTDVVFHAHGPGREPSAGMRSFPVDLAVVVDPTLVEDTHVDRTKIQYVAVVEIDDADPTRPSPAEPPAALLEQFDDRVREVATAIAGLAGAAVSDDLIPNRVAGHDFAAASLAGAFIIELDGFGYRSHDPLAGWQWRRTSDGEELLYWLADDIASATAWRWAQRTPAFTQMPRHHALRTLWMPYWHMLMHGLRPDWGRRTRATLRTLTDADSTPPPAADLHRRAR